MKKEESIIGFTNDNTLLSEVAHKEMHTIYPNEKEEISRTVIALERSKALQTAILEALAGCKFLLNKEGYFIHYYSSSEASFLIKDLQNIKGKTLSDVFPSYVAQAILTNIKWSIEHQIVQHFEFIIPLEEGMQYFEARINAVNDTEVIAFFHNITDKKIAQEQLKKKLEELDAKNRELKKYIDSNLELENFAYVASHDLREPIRTIKNFAHLLESRYKDKLDKTAMRHIRFIVEGAAQMNDLVEDLLTYSRVNTAKRKIEVINIKQILHEVLRGLDRSITETASIIIIDEFPQITKGNATQMKQLLLNLISNAIKFKKPDTANTISISMKGYGEHWKLAIKDNGIGIQKEFQKQIFLLFKKLHNTQHYSGTGLGLAICEKIVKQHEGDIWVESNAGEGATFCCTLKKDLALTEE